MAQAHCGAPARVSPVAASFDFPQDFVNDGMVIERLFKGVIQAFSQIGNHLIVAAHEGYSHLAGNLVRTIIGGDRLLLGFLQGVSPSAENSGEFSAPCLWRGSPH